MKAQVVVYATQQNKKHILLLQTGSDRDGIWQNVTGSIDAGESFEEGAKRELFEETAIRAEVISTNLEYRFFDRWKKNVIEKVFYIQLDKIPVVTISEEHQNYKWVLVNEVTKDDFGYPSNFEAFLKTKDLP